jgi:predicted DNA-binding protein
MKTDVRVSPALHEQLSYYHSVTGTSINKCINEAIRNWLECIAPDRLERVLSQGEIKCRF